MEQNELTRNNKKKQFTFAFGVHSHDVPDASVEIDLFVRRMDDLFRVVIARGERRVVEKVRGFRLESVHVEHEAMSALVHGLNVVADSPEVDVGIAAVIFGLREILPPSFGLSPVHLGESSAPSDVGFGHVLAVMFPNLVAVSLEIFVAEFHVAASQFVRGNHGESVEQMIDVLLALVAGLGRPAVLLTVSAGSVA